MSTQELDSAAEATLSEQHMSVEVLCTAIIDRSDGRENTWEWCMCKLVPALQRHMDVHEAESGQELLKVAQRIPAATITRTTGVAEIDWFQVQPLFDALHQPPPHEAESAQEIRKLKQVLRALKVLVEKFPAASTKFVELDGIPLLVSTLYQLRPIEEAHELGRALSPAEPSFQQAILGKGEILCKGILESATTTYRRFWEQFLSVIAPSEPHVAPPEGYLANLRIYKCYSKITNYFAERPPLGTFMDWPAMAALYPALPGWLDSSDVTCVEGALFITAEAAEDPHRLPELVDAGVVDRLPRFMTPEGMISNSELAFAATAAILLNACPEARQ
jgi:hypothetical protein